ncbi:MAG: hypothetical protein L0216_10820 [Planctomycetales bacterium]|nr:hypothetical protein [Planctomycetales bacterium]
MNARSASALLLLLAAASAAAAQDEGLGGEAPGPPPPLPDLLRKLGEGTMEEREVATWELSRHGAAAAEPLGEALEAGAGRRRAHAAEALDALRGAAAAAAPALLRVVKWSPGPKDDVASEDLDRLRSFAWRAIGRVGGPAGAGAALEEVRRCAQQSFRTAEGTVPGWTPDAAGAALRLGGEKERKALAELLLQALSWPVKYEPLLRAVGGARHESVVWVLIPVVDAGEREARARGERIREAKEKADRLKKDPPPEEPPKPTLPIVHSILKEATGAQLPTAARWASWWKENSPYLYWSATSARVRVDEEAQRAKVPTATWRKDHPWPAGGGPDPAPEPPRLGGALPRTPPPPDGERPGEGELPGNG